MASSKACDEEARALEDFQKRIFAFTQTAAMRCAVDLGISDIVDNHPGGITLTDLSSAVGCAPDLLHRIMRYLTHHHIFKLTMKTDDQGSSIISYTQTPLSRLLMKNKMGPFVTLVSNPMIIACKLYLSKFLVSKNNFASPFEAAYGMDFWQYTAANPSFGEMFKKGMACHAMSIVSALIENYKAAFEGIGCLVDIGGGDGTALRALVTACPWIIRAINFDLPHVVSPLVNEGCVEHVGGDMFETVPKADSALLMWVLHDWDDGECVKILKNCIKAIPRETGKVVIVEIVLDNDDNLKADTSNQPYKDFHLNLDMEMLSLTTKGKERTSREWANVLMNAGFTRYTMKHIKSLLSVIEAYP